MPDPSARFATCSHCDRSKSDFLAVTDKEMHETTWPVRFDAFTVCRSCGVTDIARPTS